MRSAKILVSFAVLFAGVASAGTIGPDGLDTAPGCDSKTTLLKVIRDGSNKKPTGIKASSHLWDMEIIANVQDGSWTLIGESRKPGSQKGVACLLSADIMGFPADITQETFYQKYFGSVLANKALIEKAMVEAKQRK